MTYLNEYISNFLSYNGVSAIVRFDCYKRHYVIDTPAGIFYLNEDDVLRTYPCSNKLGDLVRLIVLCNGGI